MASVHSFLQAVLADVPLQNVIQVCGRLFQGGLDLGRIVVHIGFEVVAFCSSFHQGFRGGIWDTS